MGGKSGGWEASQVDGMRQVRWMGGKSGGWREAGEVDGGETGQAGTGSGGRCYLKVCVCGSALLKSGRDVLPLLGQHVSAN